MTRRLADVAVLTAALLLGAVAYKRAEDAAATARVARTAAEQPAPPAKVDLSAYDAALRQIELDARRSAQCVELLWHAHNQARRAWPAAPRFELPASDCPLPPFDAIGSQREWRGVQIGPGLAVDEARKAARR